MRQDDLQRSPFGRRLSLRLHRLPRGTGELDWEVDRGYHLSLFSDSMFELNLRPRPQGHSNDALPIEPEACPCAGSSRLLIWQKEPRDESGWAEFASLVKGKGPWQAALILSPSSENRSTLSALMRRRSHWKGASCPVVELFQDTPAATFFTVEKNLFALGRAGRRVERFARLRSFLPW